MGRAKQNLLSKLRSRSEPKTFNQSVVEQKPFVERMELNKILALNGLGNIDLEKYEELRQEIHSYNSEQLLLNLPNLPEALRVDLKTIFTSTRQMPLKFMVNFTISTKAVEYLTILASAKQPVEIEAGRKFSETPHMDWWGIHKMYLDDCARMIDLTGMDCPIDLDVEDDWEYASSQKFIDYTTSLYENLSKEKPKKAEEISDCASLYIGEADIANYDRFIRDKLYNTGRLYGALMTYGTEADPHKELEKMNERINEKLEAHLAKLILEVDDNYTQASQLKQS